MPEQEKKKEEQEKIGNKMSSGHQTLPGGYSGRKEHKRWALLFENKVTHPTSLVERNKRNTQEQEKLGHSNFTSNSTRVG
jgi:hypothetical protein